MQQDVIIRHVDEHDFEAVATLLAELGNPALTPETEASIRATFQRHLAAPDTASLLAERDGIPIGFITMHIRERLNRLMPEAWVPNFIITAREHGSGVAQALFGHACEVARQRGCYRIVLESNYPLIRAHNFYLRQGMRDAGKYFTMRLDTPDL